MIASVIFLVGLATVHCGLEDTTPFEEFLQKADFVSKKHVTCAPRSFSKIGCFKSSSSPNLKLLINDQDPTSPFNKGYLTDMTDFAKSTRSLACRCSSQAAKEGYTYFSIRFWGQCWVGKDYKNVEKLVDDPKTHKSPDCANPAYQQCNDNQAHECIAWENADYIYSIYGANRGDPNIDGGYEGFSAWTKCSEACGEGVIERERTCTKPIPKGTGKDCSSLGPASETKPCRIKECKIDGRFTQWTKFSTCTRSCGGGLSRRHRLCTNPRPKNNGAYCKGADVETKKCQTQACPVHGGYSQWSRYGPCTATCGLGEKSRVRKCTSPAYAHGGRKCDYLGNAEEKAPCNVRPCPIDGVYTNWGAFTRCTKTCGTGQHTRVRLCSHPRPQFGGKSCVGPFIEHEECNTDPCPINGGWSTYSIWDKCSVSCGGGITRHRRTCTNPAPDHGGDDCAGPSVERKACKTQNCPINGHYTEWSAFEECTKSCGGGTKTRARTCTNPPPMYGGNKCGGPASNTAPCNTHKCPIHGGYTAFGPWHKCSKSCGGGTQIRERTCTNPPPQYGGDSCLGAGPAKEKRECETQACARYTKFGPWSKCTKSCAGGSQKRTRTCYAPGVKGRVDCSHLGESEETRVCEPQPCPIHGRWSSWTPWSVCTKKCGKGSKTKSRTCNKPPAQYGGRACRGYEMVMASCQIKPCAIDGKWTDWSEFGTCSKMCGTGTHNRVRECSNPEAKYGGKKCPGPAVDSKKCNTDPCPVDGGWSQWGLWRKCTKTCGGGRTYRLRRCTAPSPKYGGERCPGAPIQAKQCGTIKCPVDGGWSTYSAYGACTKSCGGGTTTSTRNCDKPTPRYSGKSCPGAPARTKPCSTQHCPVDGVYGPWTDWTQCTYTCGGGQQTRTRVCTPPKYGGKECDVLGAAADERECNTALCPVRQYHVMHACEGDIGKLTCKKGNGKIHIIDAKYGREKRWICGNVDFWDYNCKLPWEGTMSKGTRIVHGMCESKQECTVPASDKLFGDPCKLTFKYLEVMYQCYGGRYPELAGDEENEEENE